ncbi:hypothetical protein BD779DRAFT_855924 [Infundibulicybe gibba]|nr:hypothetical protein BD779DRAFT_855924 [Infundibulicybe gibba]
MLFNNTNTLITEANNVRPSTAVILSAADTGEQGTVMSSLDSDASIYSCESYQGPQEPTPKPCMSPHDLDILKEIGAGRTSKTYLVRHKESAKLYALKVVSKAGLSDAEVQRTLKQQAVHAVIAKTGNFLLPLVASWHDERNFYITTVGTFPCMVIRRLTFR